MKISPKALQITDSVIITTLVSLLQRALQH